MPLTGYLKIDDIPGESRRARHEDEIEIHDVKWNVEQSTAVAVGRGRSRSRAKVDPLVLSKFVDASSVYLQLACMRGKSFDEVVLSLRKDSGDAHLDYLTITLENVTISRYEIVGGTDGNSDLLEEAVALVFEKITSKYIVQADDHSAGDEHEISYDVAAGA